MNNTLEYKGFKAKIEYSPEDDVFVGRVLGLGPKHVMSFHGTSLRELKSAFKESIELHLELSKKEGRKIKPYSGKILFRFDGDLHAQIAEAAARAGKSINQFGEEVFTAVVKNRPRRKNA
ncbi:MAG: type II toxin-antitoxin system HicB family antitoxin [Acidobacteria bacterium]|nr:type II toxin-antitoxin system HicB family antitoxin [Acidobacteriota bacterium]